MGIMMTMNIAQAYRNTIRDNFIEANHHRDNDAECSVIGFWADCKLRGEDVENPRFPRY